MARILRQERAERWRPRRWPFLVAGGVALALGALACGWFVWLPNYRPGLRTGEVYGIDVSSHQDGIDWRRVARDDISFAYIKATEGGDVVDHRFADNWAGAQQAGVARGAYHFFTLCAPGDVQARNFLGVVPNDADPLAPAVDLELKGNCRARPARRTVRRELTTFLELVESKTGSVAILYVGDDFEGQYTLRDSFRRPLWHRQFLKRPSGDRWVIWQLHGYARVDGVTGNVDLNVMRPAHDVLAQDADTSAPG